MKVFRGPQTADKFNETFRNLHFRTDYRNTNAVSIRYSTGGTDRRSDWEVRIEIDDFAEIARQMVCVDPAAAATAFAAAAVSSNHIAALTSQMLLLNPEALRPIIHALSMSLLPQSLDAENEPA